MAIEKDDKKVKTLRSAPTGVLTKKQGELLVFVLEYREENGVSPTLDEIAEKMGTTKITVFDHLKLMEQKGYVEREENYSRSIVILHVPEEIKTNLKKSFSNAIRQIALTQTQKKILEFIILFINGKGKGKSPTLEEMAEKFGVTKVTIQEHVCKLIHKRCISNRKFKARSIRVLYYPPS